LADPGASLDASGRSPRYLSLAAHARPRGRACGDSPTSPGFAVAARAFGAASEPLAEVEVTAGDALPAAALVAALISAILEGQVPAGLASAREAICPRCLGELEKRGVRVDRPCA
jgi:hypothetical protein